MVVGPPVNIASAPPQQPHVGTPRTATVIWGATPPGTTERAYIVKLVNQDQHIFAVWKTGAGGTSVAALYAVAGNGTPIWTVTLAAALVELARVWDAGASGEWVMFREAPAGSSEFSKWDTTGLLWSTTAIDNQIQGNLSFDCAGIAGDGVRSVCHGSITPFTAWQAHLLEGADATITTTMGIGNTGALGQAVAGAVSRDGKHMVVVQWDGTYTIHDIENDVQTGAGVINGSGWTADVGSGHQGAAISGDGAAVAVLGYSPSKLVINKWGGSFYTPISYPLPGAFGQWVEMSNDGTTCVAFSTQSDNGGTLWATVVNVTTGVMLAQWNLFGLGIPESGYIVGSGIEDDGSEFGLFIAANQLNGIAGWRALKADATPSAMWQLPVGWQLALGMRAYSADYGVGGAYATVSTRDIINGDRGLIFCLGV